MILQYSSLVGFSIRKCFSRSIKVQQDENSTKKRKGDIRRDWQDIEGRKKECSAVQSGVEIVTSIRFT